MCTPMRSFVAAVLLAFGVCFLGAAAPRGAGPGAAPATAISVEKQVAAFLAEQDWGQSVAILKPWLTAGANEKMDLLEELQKHLNSTEVLPLVNTADMVVFSRLAKGTMTFHGEGLMLKQDVFVTGGKAACAIEMMLGVRLPALLEEMTEDDRFNNVSAIKAAVTAYKKGVADARHAKQE
jgi:hypothetical protein